MRPYIKSASAVRVRSETVPAQVPHTLASLLAHETAEAPLSTSCDASSSSDDDVIDVKGVVKLLHVGRNKLYDMVARNQIPHRRFGRCIRFSRAAIMRWLDSCSLQDAKERQ